MNSSVMKLSSSISNHLSKSIKWQPSLLHEKLKDADKSSMSIGNSVPLEFIFSHSHFLLCMWNFIFLLDSIGAVNIYHLMDYRTTRFSLISLFSLLCCNLLRIRKWVSFELVFIESLTKTIGNSEWGLMQRGHAAQPRNTHFTPWSGPLLWWPQVFDTPSIHLFKSHT